MCVCVFFWGFFFFKRLTATGTPIISRSEATPLHQQKNPPVLCCEKRRWWKWFGLNINQSMVLHTILDGFAWGKFKVWHSSVTFLLKAPSFHMPVHFRFSQWFRTNHRNWAELQCPGLALKFDHAGGLTGRRRDVPVVIPPWRAQHTWVISEDRNNYGIITGLRSRWAKCIIADF